MRTLKALAAAILASMIGILPSCGTTGGGGMKMDYLMDLSPRGVESVRM